jgi:hypothetical protein
MNLTVYIDDASTRELGKYAKIEKRTRNALVREAIYEWLKKRGAAGKWPESVMAYEGDPAIEPFETYRSSLIDPNHNPLA